MTPKNNRIARLAPLTILLLAIALLPAVGDGFYSSLGSGAESQDKNPRNTSRQQQAESNKKKEKKDEKDQAKLDLASARPEIWRDPGNLERRDLLYGAGGRAGAPDPAAKYTYIKDSKSGTQKKIIVKDDRGREWTVKFGPEARPETAASRIVWAVGYHTDQDYFVRQAYIGGAKSFDARDVRFERRDDGYKEVGNWSWKENPFEGTRELDGLKTLMALLNNWDLKSVNNKIVRHGKSGPAYYYVSDLGASLGRTGSWINKICLFRDLPPDKLSGRSSKGDPEAYADEHFVEKVRDGKVVIHHGRARGRSILKDVSAANAYWIGTLLGRLSDKQLADAFRASGFDQTQITLYVRTMRERINELRTLPQFPDRDRFTATSERR